MTDQLTPEAVKAALEKTSVFDLVSMTHDLAREYLRLKEVEKAAQWVVDNPRAHPANMVKVCRAAVEGK